MVNEVVRSLWNLIKRNNEFFIYFWDSWDQKISLEMKNSFSNWNVCIFTRHYLSVTRKATFSLINEVLSLTSNYLMKNLKDNCENFNLNSYYFKNIHYLLILMLVIIVIGCNTYIVVGSIINSYKLKDQKIKERNEMIENHYRGILETMNSTFNKKLENTTSTYESIIGNLTSSNNEYEKNAKICNDKLSEKEIDQIYTKTWLGVKLKQFKEWVILKLKDSENLSQWNQNLNSTVTNELNLVSLLNIANENIEILKKDYAHKLEFFYNCRLFNLTDEARIRQLYEFLQNWNLNSEQLLQNNTDLFLQLSEWTQNLTLEKDHSKSQKAQHSQQVKQLNNIIDAQNKEINEPIIDKIIRTRALEAIVGVLGFISIGFFIHVYLF